MQQSSYKLAMNSVQPSDGNSGGVVHHQKSQSLGQAPQGQATGPGIFKMYMGSVKQLKKSSKMLAL